MCTIAVGLVARMLALTEESGLGFLGFEDDRCNGWMGLVTSITEGLAFGMPASAPGIGFSCFQLNLCWEFRGDVGFGHFCLLEFDATQ